ncbi:MAG: PKD domain-containing protein [Crocinitomicaceae bacterium]|nr:PKD domain-containing protein [Crocinitomicaceae bacterium]
MKQFFALFFLLVGLFGFSQNQNNIWYFGDGNFLDFNVNFNNPVLTGNGAEIATANSTYCLEGSSTVCDAAGNLLFYNNSENVFDRNFNPMPNGVNLNGSATTSAQTLAIPKPGSQTIYYIFHMDFAASAANLGLYYSEVDMSLNGGLGDVTVNKNILLGGGGCSEQLKAITHCNGEDIWVISHSVLGNTFNCFLVSSAGVQAVPVSTSIGASHLDVLSGMSYMTCTKDGSRVALAGEMGGNASVEVFSFDNQNGTFCDPQYLPVPDFSTYGVEFSADGTKIYTTGFQLHQYDFNTANWFSYPPPEIGAALMRGPNDKIYLVAGCDYYDNVGMTMFYSRDIHVINDPNNVGVAANLQMNAYLTPRECGLGLSTCYYPTQTGNTCGPVLTANATGSSTNICVDDCITYTDLSVGPIVSYDWTFTGGSPSTFSGMNPPSICYPAAGSYTTTLIVTDCAGNSSTTDITINVNDCSGPQVLLEAGQTQICATNCINFIDLSLGVNINDWSWSFPGGNPMTSTDQNPQNICYDTPGTYDVTLMVTDDNGTNTVTIPNYIQVDACLPPIANFQIPNLCAGDCIDIMDLSTNSPTQWNWSLNGAVNTASSDQNPQNICFQTPGVYPVELTVSNNFGTDTYIQDVVVMSSPNAGSDVFVFWCETELVQNLELLLDQGVPTNGVWLNPQNTAGLVGAEFFPQISGPGVYSIVYELTNGNCTDDVVFEITVGEAPNAGLDGVITVCDNDSPFDLFDVLQGNPDNGGFWSPALASNTAVLDPSIDPEGIYTYTVAASANCSSDFSQAEVEITYISSLAISPVSELCSDGDPVTLNANIPNGVWSGSGITDANLGIFSPSSANGVNQVINYTVTLDNCIASVPITVTVLDLPIVDLGNDITHCVSEELLLSVDISDADQVIWWNGVSENQQIMSFDNYTPGDEAAINVEVSNSCGSMSDDLIVEIIDCDIYVYVPNSFTPDGNEFNQVFTPSVVGDYISTYELQIFNRWGQRIFQSFDLTEGWDGSFNGENVQDGIYTWKMKIEYSVSEKKKVAEYNGHVNLIR